MANSGTVNCPYCGSFKSKLKWEMLSHPEWTSLDPIEMWQCEACGSLTTVPMPKTESLAAIYTKLETGYPSVKSAAKINSLQFRWYEDLLDLFEIRELHDEKIADFGSGEGFLAIQLCKRLSRNCSIDCYDMHDAPNTIQKLSVFGDTLNWFKCDLNDISLDSVDGGFYDRIFLISVVEHVTDPLALLNRLYGMLTPKGKLHVVGPLLTNLASFMGKRWPYIIPNEHLTIPSLTGLNTLCQQLGISSYVRRIPVTYSLRYVISALIGVEIPTHLDFTLRLPIGCFGMTLKKNEDKLSK